MCALKRKSESKVGLGSEELAKMVAIFKHFRGIGRVVLFGSRALGNYKRGSDVDLALFGTIDKDMVFQVHEELEEGTGLPYFFDVVDYVKIENPDLKCHIDEYGQEIFNQSKL